MQDLNNQKARFSQESSDVSAQLADAEHRVGALTKEKAALASQLEEARRSLEEETRARQKLQSDLRNLNADIDTLREQLEEEQESKSDMQRQLSKANSEVQQWRAKFEGEGTARAEELEEAKYVIDLNIMKSSFFVGDRCLWLCLTNKCYSPWTFTDIWIDTKINYYQN